MSTVFVFEHFVGGGQLGRPLPPSLAEEGGGMLAAVVADFCDAGHTVLTTLDSRVPLALDGAQIRAIRAEDDAAAVFEELARAADAALVIAPEPGGYLHHWIARLQRTGTRSLGCALEAIDLCGDKLAMAHHLADTGVPTPTTVTGPASLDAPMIAKPRYGAGCEATFVVRHHDELAHLPAAAAERIYQPFIAGRAASVSLLVHDGQAQPLLAGEQHIDESTALMYTGGCLPLRGAVGERAVDLALRAVASVSGLGGFVGVDLVLGEQASDDRVIEINPRLTVSFTGLRRLCTPRLADAMLDPNVRLSWRDRTVCFDHAGRITWEASP